MKAELEADFESFVAVSGDHLYRIAYAITRDPQLAEDAVRSALAATYSRWKRVAIRPEAFVRRMLLREILGRGGRRTTPVRPQEDVPLRRTGPAGRQNVVDTDAVWAALNDMPVGQRAIIVLRYYERLGEDAVAAALATRTDIVHAQTSAALSDLRRLLTIARLRARA
jgi:DNA-directed RNA polymerase specialized sigma24 family protein